MRHWLTDPATSWVVPDVSVRRDFSPNGSDQGQLTFFDYTGKPSGHNNYVGSNGFPSMIARVLPDGGSWFDRFDRNSFGAVTNEISTYTLADGTVGLRTNKLIYATNGIDLLIHIGPSGEQVVSNYFSNG